MFKSQRSPTWPPPSSSPVPHRSRQPKRKSLEWEARVPVHTAQAHIRQSSTANRGVRLECMYSRRHSCEWRGMKGKRVPRGT